MLSGERASEGAGTQGDAVKALQSLPGLGRGGVGGGDLVMWGSTPRESRIEIDGVEIPLLYHGSGVRSVLPSGIVGSLHSVPGAFDVEHGRALGGLVIVDTTPADALEPKLRVSADLLDTSVLASAPVRALDGAARVAARYGYVDRWLPPLIAPPLRGSYRVPAYWDAQAEVSHRIAADESVRLVCLSSSDQSRTDLESDDAAQRQQTQNTQRFGRIYAQYHDTSAPNRETWLTPFVGLDQSQQALSVGAQSSGLRTSAWRYGLRARHRERFTAGISVSVGVDASGSVTHVERSGSLSVPPHEGAPYPFGTPPGSAFTPDTFRTHVLGVAPFIESELATRGLTVTPGLRIEPTLIETSRARPPTGSLPEAGKSQLQAGFEPRLSVEQRLPRGVRLFGSVGRYHEAPDPADLSARFGNPALGLASATHALFGESANLFARTRVEVSGYAKWLSGLATPSTDPQPRLGEVLVATGQGRAFGTQLFVRQAESHGLSGWLSATLSRSERRDDNGQRRLSDYDSPLVLAASAVQRWGAFRFGARARFASGAPRTPVVGAYYDLTAQRYQPLLGVTNSVRLRDFFQLDLRLDRHFQCGPSTAVELYLDALNVTFRRNQERMGLLQRFQDHR